MNAASVLADPPAPAGAPGPLGRALRVCPGKRPGLAAPAALLGLGGLFLLFLVGVATDSGEVETSDLVLLGVLTALGVVPGLLLAWRRARRIRAALAFRVFERGIVREEHGRQDEIRFSDVTDLRRTGGVDGGLVLGTPTGACVLDSGRLDEVDASLVALVQALLEGRPLTAAQARAGHSPPLDAPVTFSANEAKEDRAYGAPVVGEGTVALGPDGLRLQARAARDLVPTIGAVIAALAGLLGTAILFSALDVDFGRQTGKLAALVALAAGGLPATGVYSWLRARVKGGAVDRLVPWCAVRTLAVDGPRVTVRLTEPDFRGDVVLLARDPALNDALAAAFASRLER